MKIFSVIYILLLSCFISNTLWAQDQVNVNLLNNTLIDVYRKLTPFFSVSYKLDITVKLNNSIINSYKADVFEVWDKDAHASLSLYKLGDKDVLFTYSDISGIERFWFGRFENLPEVLSNQVDQTVLDSSITYSSLLINPSWLNLPFNLKEDQGFKVVQTYNKNLYSSLSKTEFYLNKDNIPIRMLYYNSISNFPVLEALVTDYKKINNGFFITKITYKNSSNNKLTFLEKSNIVINPKIPNSFLEVQKLIKNNINNFNSSFLIGIKSSIDISSFTNMPVVPLENKNPSLEDSHKIYNNIQKDMNNTGSNTLPDNSNNVDSNNTLLKVLQGLDNGLSSDSLENNSSTSKNTKKVLKKEQSTQSIAKKQNFKKVDLKNNNNSQNTNNTSAKNKTNTHLQQRSKNILNNNLKQFDSIKKLKNNVPPAVQEPKSPAVQEPKSPAVQEPKSPAVQEPKSPAVQEPKSPAVQEPNKSINEDLNSLF